MSSCTRPTCRTATARRWRSAAARGGGAARAPVHAGPLGRLLNVGGRAADLQDRDGAALVLDRRTRALFPFIAVLFADAGHRGPRAAPAVRRRGASPLR